MKNYFNTQKKRTILSRSYYHEIPQLHPNRIMDEHYFLYMLEGGWSIGQNGAEYEILPDDVIVMPAGQHHYPVSYTLPMTKYIWILASVADGDCYSDETFENPEYISLDTKISCRGYNAPKKFFEEIAVECFSKNKYSNIKLSSLFNVLLCELSLIKNNTTATVSSNNLFKEMLSIMSTNPEKFYKIKDFAKIFSVSERTVTNIFFKHTGESVHEYQLKMKIEIIKLRIQFEPNIKMKLIAKEYGFCDEFHMSRVFKKYEGGSPTEYKAIYGAK